MRKTILLVILLVPFLAISQSKVAEYTKNISEDRLKKHLTYIASDEMEGRDTGSKGQKKVGDYIAKHFSALGLSPIIKKDDGSMSYFQDFNLYKSGWKDAYIIVNNKKKIFFQNFFPIGMVNIPVEKTIETVFVGYGIKNDTQNDYEGKILKGKAVIFIEGELKKENEKSEWAGTPGTRKKQKIASELGALYAFEISLADSEKFKTLNAERKAVLSRFNRVGLSKTTQSATANEPAFVISKELASELLGIKSKKMDELIVNPDVSIKSKKTNIKIKVERGEDLLPTANIMGYMEGTDKKDEVLVISAHYDHVGIDDKGRIYNGADDDGSGTCAVMELAETYAKAKAEGNGPRRSILFLLVTGEEKGLLGSRYFTDISPAIPLDKIICDLNIDMIGRIDKKHESNPNYVYIIGADKLSSQLHEINENANKNSVNFELDYEFNDPKDPNRFYYRSDHYNFAKNKIPVIFYFTGVHEDYHKPTDDVEKILFEKYSNIVKLVFTTSWELTHRNDKIIVDSNKP